MESKFIFASLVAALQLLAFSSVAYAEETLAETNQFVEDILKSQKERENQPFWVQHNYTLHPML